jgi:hypothetical protein
MTLIKFNEAIRSGVDPESVVLAEVAQRISIEGNIPYGDALRRARNSLSAIDHAADLARKPSGFADSSGDIQVAAVDNVHISGFSSDFTTKSSKALAWLRVYLNAGTNKGLKIGDRVSVDRKIREISDPATGAVLRQIFSQIGVLEISEVADASAVATVVSGTDFKVGDAVTLIAPVLNEMKEESRKVKSVISFNEPRTGPMVIDEESVLLAEAAQQLSLQENISYGEALSRVRSSDQNAELMRKQGSRSGDSTSDLLIAGVDDARRQVYLSGGSKAGVQVGDKFQVHRITPVISNPNTGKTIHEILLPVGTIRVTEVHDTASVAVIISGSDFRDGDLVRPAAK